MHTWQHQILCRHDQLPLRKCFTTCIKTHWVQQVRTTCFQINISGRHEGLIMALKCDWGWACVKMTVWLEISCRLTRPKARQAEVIWKLAWLGLPGCLLRPSRMLHPGLVNTNVSHGGVLSKKYSVNASHIHTQIPSYTIKYRHVI